MYNTLYVLNEEKKVFHVRYNSALQQCPRESKDYTCIFRKKPLRIILFCIVNPKHKHDSVSTFLDPNHFMCVCACVRIRAYGKK